MTSEILTNGIYFIQTDKKEDGYYTKGKQGELIKHVYKEPSIWNKLKHLIYYGYGMNIDTKSTAFLYFDKYSKETVHSGAMSGDAVSTAKKIKKQQDSFSFFNSGDTYIKTQGKILINRDDCSREIEVTENGMKIVSKFIFKEINDYSRNYPKIHVFTFLNWDNL